MFCYNGYHPKVLFIKVSFDTWLAQILGFVPNTMATDLADVRHIRKENNNNGYLLVCIDDQPWGNVIPEKLSPIITSIWSEVHTLNVPNTPPQ